MKWLVDENLSLPALVQFLQLQGHDVKCVSPGTPDSILAGLDREEGRVLLTHDKGFANILAYPPAGYSGIVRVNIHPPQLDLVTAALAHLLAQVNPQVFQGRLITLDTVGFRSFPKL